MQIYLQKLAGKGRNRHTWVYMGINRDEGDRRIQKAQTAPLIRKIVQVWPMMHITCGTDIRARRARERDNERRGKTGIRCHKERRKGPENPESPDRSANPENSPSMVGVWSAHIIRIFLGSVLCISEKSCIFAAVFENQAYEEDFCLGRTMRNECCRDGATTGGFSTMVTNTAVTKCGAD